MARCPFATWYQISGSSGPNVGGPFKIIHHTTEGSTAEGVLKSFARNRSDRHFTVDAARIFQHIDTAEGARALRNAPGIVQTNSDSAVQIELVGFAHLAKDAGALTKPARLCRWIEATHAGPKVWPSGLPRPAKNGHDPGRHNRDASTWDTQSEDEFRMDQAALAIIIAIATQNQLAVVQESVAALSKLAEDDDSIRLFYFHAATQGSGNFQLAAVQSSANGVLSVALGAFYFRSIDDRPRFLFFKWGAQEVHFWTAAQRMTLNTAFYERRRDEVLAQLEADAPQYIAGLKLGSR